MNRGEGLSPWLPLSSWQKNVAQLLSLPLGADVCPHPLLDELECPLVLGDLEQLHGSSLVRGEATHLPDHVPHELGVFRETLRETGGSGPGLQGSADDGSPDPPHLPNLIGIKAARHARPFARPVPGP